MILPRNSNPFELGQAVITRRFLFFKDLFYKKGYMSKTGKDFLIHVIELRIWFYSIYYPCFHADYYLTFDDINFFN